MYELIALKSLARNFLWVEPLSQKMHREVGNQRTNLAPKNG